MNASDLAQLSSRMSRFQHSFVGICVALLLSGGLVSVPASCECGTSIAHGHSLFTLPGHHHGTDGWIADDNQPDTLRANQLSI